MQRLFIPVVLLALLGAGCGGAADDAPGLLKPGATSRPAASADAKVARQAELATSSSRMAWLIPDSTQIYVEIRSLDALEQLLQRCADLGIQRGAPLNAERFMQGLDQLLPGDLRQIARDRPLGVAVSFTTQGEPQPTFVLPVKDAAAFKRTLQLPPSSPSPAFDGDYIAVSQVPLYERPKQPVALARGIDSTAAIITVRGDLLGLTTSLGPTLIGMINTFPDAAIAARRSAGRTGPDRESFEEMAAAMRLALQTGERVELLLNVREDTLEISGAFDARAGSALDGWSTSTPMDLTVLSKSIVASDGFAALCALDKSFLEKRVAPMLAAACESKGLTLDESTVALGLRSISSLFGEQALVVGDFGAGDTHFAVHCLPDDPDAFEERLLGMLKIVAPAQAGFVPSARTHIEVEGVQVCELRLEPDGEALAALAHVDPSLAGEHLQRVTAVTQELFGAPNLRVRLAVLGKHALIAVGEDDAWFRRTLVWTKEGQELTPPDVKGALRGLAGASPAMLVRYDLGALASGATELIPRLLALARGVDPDSTRDFLPPPMSSHPCPVTMYAGVTGLSLRFGMSLDLPGLRALALASR